jgi:uncharacterized membrane-anchored protein
LGACVFFGEYGHARWIKQEEDTGHQEDAGYDYLKAKESKKKRRQEKALRQKGERHISRQQEIEELLIDAIENDTENGDEQ